MRREIFFFPVAAVLALAGCATPNPDLPPSEPDEVAVAGGQNGKALLERSARSQGNDLRRYREVKVAYDGTWSSFPKLTQKVLVDADFRETSEEVYFPAVGKVKQIHRGPGGQKTVVRSRPDAISVSYEGRVNEDSEVKAAAALVADAYTMFLFGSSWLLKHGSEFSYLGQRDVEGVACDLVAVTLRPGLGVAERDRAVAWLDGESGVMRRVTFTLNGLDSTQGAEVDVTFDDFLTASDGSLWPGYFLEMIRRPVNTRAHEWRATSLVVDGQRVR